MEKNIKSIRQFVFNKNDLHDVVTAFGVSGCLNRDSLIEIKPCEWKENPEAWLLTGFLNNKEMSIIQDLLEKNGYLFNGNYAEERIYIKNFKEN